MKSISIKVEKKNQKWFWFGSKKILPASKILCLTECCRPCQNCQALISSSGLFSSRNISIITLWKRNQNEISKMVIKSRLQEPANFRDQSLSVSVGGRLCKQFARVSKTMTRTNWLVGVASRLEPDTMSSISHRRFFSSTNFFVRSDYSAEWAIG